MKKVKVILTPEEKIARKAQRKILAKVGFKEGIIPFFIQIGILAAVILEFVFLIANPAIPHVPGVPDLLAGTEVINDPNWARLIYMILCIPAVFFLLKWSSKITDNKKAFWPALIAAILTWQAIGEGSWHFGLVMEGSFSFFPRIEGVQGTFFLLFTLPIVIYLAKTKRLPWFLLIYLFTFYANWVGHWLIMGAGPMWFANVYPNPERWPEFIGFIFGLHGSMMLVYRILCKAKTTEERLLLSIALYMFVGLFLEGGLGLGGSLQ